MRNINWTESIWKQKTIQSDVDFVEYGLTPIQNMVLNGRDIKDLNLFFSSDINDLYNPIDLPDAEKATEIIKTAINKQWKTVIYGDYDNDGALATSIGMLGLKPLLKDNVDFYINNRFKQGYGIVKSGIDEILKKHPDCKLIITVDNGISAFEAIEYAKSKGLIVLITDHHETMDTLPIADAIVDAKRKDNQYPCPHLCGAAIIWKVLMLLYWEMDLEMDYIYDMIDIVADATIGDVVPLIDENRLICRVGLKRMMEGKRLAFRLLNKLTHNDYPEQLVGFKYAPMVNSVGRLDGNCDIAVELFLSEDEVRVQQIIDFLDKKNEERKRLTEEQLEIAEAQLEDIILKYGHLPDVIVLKNDEFHEGIVGLIAGRLKEKYNRPSIVFTLVEGSKDVYKGSARSIDGFNIKESFDVHKKLLLGYGGHPKAGGLSINDKNYEKFCQEINDYAETILTDELKQKTIHIDTILTHKDITLELIKDLKFLGPFGEGFPFPNIVLNLHHDRIIGLKDSKTGQPNVHLKLMQDTLGVLLWNKYEEFEDIGSPENISCLGIPTTNIYNNNVYVQFICNEYKIM